MRVAALKGLLRFDHFFLQSIVSQRVMYVFGDLSKVGIIAPGLEAIAIDPYAGTQIRRAADKPAIRILLRCSGDSLRKSVSHGSGRTIETRL